MDYALGRLSRSSATVAEAWTQGDPNCAAGRFRRTATLLPNVDVRAKLATRPGLGCRAREASISLEARVVSRGLARIRVMNADGTGRRLVANGANGSLAWWPAPSEMPILSIFRFMHHVDGHRLSAT